LSIGVGWWSGRCEGRVGSQGLFDLSRAGAFGFAVRRRTSEQARIVGRRVLGHRRGPLSFILAGHSRSPRPESVVACSEGISHDDEDPAAVSA